MVDKNVEFVTIPGFQRYKISKEGVVLDTLTKTVVPPTWNKTFKTNSVTIHPLNRMSRKVSPEIGRLVLLAFDPPENSLIPAGVFYKDGNEENYELDNLEWDYGNYDPPFIPGKGGLVITDFVTVPDSPAPGLEINGLGQVKQNDQDLPINVDIHGYRHVSFKTANKRTTSMGVHRLLGLTFLKRPRRVNGLVINHKDGNPNNNALDNLEWTTYSGNIDHAHLTGLRNEAKPILVMDIATRKVSSYFSLGRFAQTKQDEKALHFRLKHNSEIRPFRDKWYVKYESDPRPWPEVNAVFERKTDEGIPTQVKDLRTGVVTEYDSISNAARALGTTTGTLNYQLSKITPEPYYAYLVRYTSDDPWPDYDESHIGVPATCSMKLIAKHYLTGQIRKYASKNELEKDISSNSEYVTKLLETPDASVTRTGFFIRRDTPDVKWPARGTTVTFPFTPTTMERRCLQTNTKKIYQSVRECFDDNQSILTSPTGFRERLRKGEYCVGGYSFTKVKSNIPTITNAP